MRQTQHWQRDMDKLKREKRDNRENRDSSWTQGKCKSDYMWKEVSMKIRLISGL